jgi:hypothetical protein
MLSGIATVKFTLDRLNLKIHEFILLEINYGYSNHKYKKIQPL